MKPTRARVVVRLSPRETAVVAVIESQLATLNADERRRVIAAVTSRGQRRAGPVLEYIRRLFEEQTEWYLRDLIARTTAALPDATELLVYNAIGYLKRHRGLIRLAHGYYRVRGEHE